jgi:hypothetical protein
MNARFRIVSEIAEGVEKTLFEAVHTTDGDSQVVECSFATSAEFH